MNAGFFFSPWMWFIAALLLLFLELLAPGVFFLWIAIAAAATGLVVLQLPLFSPEWQFLLFAVLAGGATWAGRRFFRPRVDGGETMLNRGPAALVGRRCELVRAIRNGSGRVRIDGSEWSARGEDLPEGRTVEIVGVDGTVLIVEPVEDRSAAG